MNYIFIFVLFAFSFVVNGSDSLYLHFSGDFKEGTIPVNYNNKAGAIDLHGKIVIPLDYASISVLDENIFLVKDSTWKIIDQNNKIVSILKDTPVSGFEEDIAIFCIPSQHAPYKLKYVDRFLNIIQNLDSYVPGSNFINGVATVTLDTQMSKWIYVDKQGKQVIDTQYSWANNFSKDSPYIAYARTVDGKEIILNREGREFFFESDTSIIIINDYNEGLASYWSSTGYGFLDSKGRMIIKPRYKWVQKFSHGLSAVSVNGRDWGYIDSQDNVVIPFKFKNAGNFSEGYAVVGVRGYSDCLINTKGEIVLDLNKIKIK